jgi:hypothetical protein
MIELKSLTPLASGQKRIVYEHPSHPDEVIKVMRPDVVAKRFGAKSRWYKRLYRARHYVGYVRELKEYIAVQARHPEFAAPIVRMRGLVETDLGLGVVSEKVRGVDGALAPTLARLYRDARGFTPTIEASLRQLLDELLASEVIVADMHPWNVVFGSDSRAGPRFVLIDGFGEKNVIPRCSMSRAVNAWNTRHLYRRLLVQVPRLVDPEIAALDAARPS